MIVITAKKDGFRRCGVAHSKNPVEYPDGHWSKKQLEILHAEPMLVVSETDEKPGTDQTGAKKKAKPPASGILDRDK
jgi:hypothetical protein